MYSQENHVEVALGNSNYFADVFCLIVYTVRKIYDKYCLSVKKSKNSDRSKIE